MKKHLKTPSNIKKKRRHGFLRKMRRASGRKTLSRRRRKARKRICL